MLRHAWLVCWFLVVEHADAYCPCFPTMMRTLSRRCNVYKARPQACFTRQILCFHMTSTKNETPPNKGNTELRRTLLRKKLEEIGVNGPAMEEAVIESLEGTYDGQFGRSAIRACRSFVYPKKITTTAVDDNEELLQVRAGRTARQVQFLWKRHQSHLAQAVRHHDNVSAAAVAVETFPLILILDNLRSAYNVGSLFRTADATGCHAIWTVGIAPHPHGSGAEKLTKSALGAERTVGTRHFDNLAAAMDCLRLNYKDYTLLGMETTEHSISYTEYHYPKTGVAIVLGNEVTGVDASMLDRLDGLIQIPMYGHKNSLNVASCAPIVLYEVIRQWQAT